MVTYNHRRFNHPRWNSCYIVFDCAYMTDGDESQRVDFQKRIKTTRLLEHPWYSPILCATSVQRGCSTRQFSSLGIPLDEWRALIVHCFPPVLECFTSASVVVPDSLINISILSRFLWG